MPISDQVVVFDLDDTLYKEREYVASGVAAVVRECLALNLISKATAEKAFVPDIAAGKFISDLLAHLELPAELEQSLLWTYRLHDPDIRMAEATKSAVAAIAKQAKALAIITDGRSLTQRKKIKALGLEHIQAFVSEEFAAGKPSPVMFEAVQAMWPGCTYCYIGDNLKKDFVAANRLGWLSICLKDDGSNVHPQSKAGALADDACPKVWAETFEAIPDLIFSRRQY
jgi:putative hydrolase of the HAD superfamily